MLGPPPPSTALGLQKELVRSCQDLPTQIQAEVPASWEAFSVGLMGIIIRFHILLCLSPFLTHQ